MNQHDWLAEQFEAHRRRLRTVAYRMLGSQTEADDAVQETWLRLSRAETSSVENLGGWLTTVVGRVCLDMLRSRKSRREHPLDTNVVEVAADPEHEVVMADSIGLALLVVLETLTPAERVAFVLHDMFGMPFEDIGPTVGRSARRQAAREQGAAPRPGCRRDDRLRPRPPARYRRRLSRRIARRRFRGAAGASGPRGRPACRCGSRPHRSGRKDPGSP